MTMDYTPTEILGVMASRLMKGTSTIFAGVGIPLLAAILAKRTHTPGLTIVVEGGSIGPQVLPGLLPISTNEMRIARRAQMLTGINEIFLLTQRGFLEVGFMGGAQIDRFGNVNTTVVGPYEKPKVRLPGSGGANDIISLCRRTVLVTIHEKRRFVPKVDFITSPGFLDGGDSRHQAGLIFGGVSNVVTDLGMMGFDPHTKAMKLESLHPGISLDKVIENTGFELIIPGIIPVTDPPTQTELNELRRLDPDRRFL
jgi:glutaconate CoA-transferase subunit B